MNQDRRPLRGDGGLTGGGGGSTFELPRGLPRRAMPLDRSRGIEEPFAARPRNSATTHGRVSAAETGGVIMAAVRGFGNAVGTAGAGAGTAGEADVGRVAYVISRSSTGVRYRPLSPY